jgi:hypothetical protein
VVEFRFDSLACFIDYDQALTFIDTSDIDLSSDTLLVIIYTDTIGLYSVCPRDPTSAGLLENLKKGGVILFNVNTEEEYTYRVKSVKYKQSSRRTHRIKTKYQVLVIDSRIILGMIIKTNKLNICI